MYYKGIIFDLDNTLYNYTECHTVALRTSLEFLCKNVQISDIAVVEQKYKAISDQLKHELPCVASSHNKAIYFKQLLENLGVSYRMFQPLHNLYWATFYAAMRPFDGARDYIEWNKQLGVVIGILTDYETEYQLIKLEKLGLLDLIDHIVTSEEIGIEKPSRRAFLTILDRMKLCATDVCMIGDNYEKDILGAQNAGIVATLWFCPMRRSTKEVIVSEYLTEETKSLKSNCPNGGDGTFGSYRALLDETIQFHKKLSEFVEISRYCGERFDLVQAGGGNVSVKHGDNKMIIKSSGIHMANMSEKHGYSIIDNCRLKKDVENILTTPSQLDISKYRIWPDSARPSIETYMHSILKTYTIHVHPIQVNRILVSKNARQTISQLFPYALIIDYYTPGIDLAIEIAKQYRGESVIFLINHGIIVTADDPTELRTILHDAEVSLGNKASLVYGGRSIASVDILENTLEKCENHEGLDFTNYKLTNKISATIGDNYITYLATNRNIYHFLENHRMLFSENHTFPDALIYCGLRVLFMVDYTDITKYRETYGEPPKIIVYHENIYIVATTYQKCKEIEDVFAANLQILNRDYEKQYLSDAEIRYLNGWDAEKYRRTI